MNETDKRIREFARHSYGSWSRQTSWVSPRLMVDAEGVYMYDDKGKPYLDFSSQLMCSNLGHKNKAIIEAIIRQAEKMPYIAPAFANEASIAAVEALRSIMPEGLEKLFFSTSGTEANEAAFKMVRQFKAPAYKVISRYHAYHGSTIASVTITGDSRRWFAEQARCTVQGVRFAPDCYCYRCPFNLQYPECHVQCARYLDYMIKEEGNVAAVLVEPVVGTNGRLVPPPEYFPILRKICDENGVLLVADEVMTGWFRTGRAFALEHWHVVPDVMSTAKGATGAYTPAGITATTETIARFFEEEVLCHGHTYAFHPLVMAAIPAAISEYRKLMDSGLPQRASKHLQKRLYELADNHDCIGDVRGIGHFWGLEMVKNRQTKEPFNVKADKFAKTELMTARVAGDAMNNGLYIGAWYDNLVVAPPLIITEEHIDEAISILEKSLEIADKEAVTTGVPASRSSEFSQEAA